MRNYSLFKSGMFHLQLSLQTFVWSNFDEISKFFQRKIIYWLFDYTTERRMRILCSTRKQKTTLIASKDLMKGKLFQRCTHLLYCRVLSLGGNLNTRWMSKPWHEIHLSHKKSLKYSGHRKLLCELWKLSNFNPFILLGY